MSDDPKAKSWAGPAHAAPYALSRLGAPIDLVDTARAIQDADQAIGTAVSGKLELIAAQIRALQDEARAILDAAARDQALHRARCSFPKRPGAVYHLYRDDGGELYFSMLSPDDWSGAPPHAFEGSYYLGADMAFVPAEKADERRAQAEMTRRLLTP